ncbi:phytase [Devosia naphthalenivorans]|uniref:phytase n=1 Tax=Devosia naphthalenivorans TaxID=2082392 RepID=UPI001FED1210|nr:phytase [Devosia naphthalenivorans]
MTLAQRPVRTTWLLLLSCVAATQVSAACAADWKVHEVQPQLQTTALTDEDADADADDPAFYVDAVDVDKSLVVAAVKNGGVRVYAFDGSLVQTILPIEDSRINNVDIIYDFDLGDGSSADLVLAADRGLDIIRVYRIDTSAKEPLTEITASDAARAFPKRHSTDGLTEEDNPVDDQATVYGLTAWHDKKLGKAWVVGTQRHQPVVGVFSLEAREGGTVRAVFDHSFSVPTEHKGQDLWQESEEDPLADFSPQFEGLVIDRVTGTIYAGQEDVGIWTVPVSGGTPLLAYETRGSETSPFFNPDSVITRDVEGLSIYYASTGTRYLLASSQGSAHGEAPVVADPPFDDSFAVFRIGDPLELLGAFRVIATGDIDAVQESDGDDVISVALPGFPNGVFVTQDGYAGDLNGLDGETDSTNFKFVDWAAIANSFDPPLEITPSEWNPRD